MDRNKPGFLPVYIYNSVEDEWSYISCLKTLAQQNERILYSNAYADSYLFANAGRKNFFFISPVPVSPDFHAYFESISGSSAVILNPLMKRPFICENIIRDKHVFNQLVVAARHYRGISLYPYATTKQVYRLKKELEKFDITVEMPESPEEKNAWTVAAFGSKNGFRSLIAGLDGGSGTLAMPAGKVFSSAAKANTYALELLDGQEAVLLKAGRGSGGHGVHIIRKNQLAENSNHIADLLGANPELWKKNKIVVEQFIETDKKTARFPSIEGYVGRDGKYRFLYTCSMLVTPEGNFFGMEVGPEALPTALDRQMRRLAKQVGLEYAARGYRGHFDIDMIYGKNGSLYMSESNTRNTGGTDAYKITRYLLGSRFGKSFILSKFIDLPRSGPVPSFAKIIKKLSPILYSPQKKVGLILSSEAALKEYSVTYFIAARTKKEAYGIEQKLHTYFHYR